MNQVVLFLSCLLTKTGRRQKNAVWALHSLWRGFLCCSLTVPLFEAEADSAGITFSSQCISPGSCSPFPHWGWLRHTERQTYLVHWGTFWMFFLLILRQVCGLFYSSACPVTISAWYNVKSHLGVFTYICLINLDHTLPWVSSLRKQTVLLGYVFWRTFDFVPPDHFVIGFKSDLSNTGGSKCGQCFFPALIPNVPASHLWYCNIKSPSRSSLWGKTK